MYRAVSTLILITVLFKVILATMGVCGIQLTALEENCYIHAHCELYNVILEITGYAWHL